MKTLRKLLIAALLAINCQSILASTVEVQGLISNNTVWNADTVKVTGDITVDSNAVLTIKPGTYIEFQGNFEINIKRQLIAIGTETDSIIFTVNDTAGFHDTETSQGGWKGIRIENGTDTSEISYARFEYAKKTALLSASGNDTLGAISLINSRARISGSVFENNCYIYGSAIDSYNSGSKIENNRFIHNKCTPLTITANSNCVIINNDILYNEDYGKSYKKNSINVYKSNVRIEKNNISNNNCSAIKIINSKFHIWSNNIEYNMLSGINTFDGWYPEVPDTSHGDIINNKIHDNGYSGIYLFCLSNKNPPVNIYNNVIYRNSAGVSLEFASQVRIINNTISNNRVWGINAFCSFINEIVNTILTGNSYQMQYTCEHELTVCPVALINCNIQGGKAGIICANYVGDFINNIDINPAFADAENHDYRLSDSSYCINTGTYDTAGLSLPLIDVEGNPRIYNEYYNRIDIGAVEFQGKPANTKPILEKTDIQYTLVSNTKKLKVNYLDTYINDKFKICISSDNPNIKVSNLSGKAPGSTYDLIPAPGWAGVSDITIKVVDDCGEMDTDTFQLIVSKEFCGSIPCDMVWDMDTVKVICDVTVEEDATLSIMPGTRIEFGNWSHLKIKGRLLALGTDSSRIVFTYDSNPNGPEYPWEGIRFEDIPESNDSSKLVCCDISGVFIREKDDYPPDIHFDGGAIHVENFDKLLIFGCNIRSNISREYGGAVYILNSDIVLKNNKIYRNESIDGGGLYIYNSDPLLINNVINNNDGGGIFIAYASPVIINNTICNNRHGGGITFLERADPIIKNCIIWGNTIKQIYVNSNNPIIEYCNIQFGQDRMPFNQGTYVYENNIDAEPYFRDINNMDYSLTDSSYCIDMGTPDTTGLNLPGIDISGNPRIYDGVADIIDIGAYEYQGDPVNRPPVISETKDIQNFCNYTLQMKVEYYDPDIYDTHTISIMTSTPYISIKNLSGDTSGSTYEIIPDHKWIGKADIYVEVIDNHGAKDIDTFNLEVTNHFCGHITEDIIWDIDTVKVDCDIVVDTNATLTITPGTVVEFQGPYKLDVKGCLMAIGTPEENITLTTSDTSGYYNNTHIGWGGIMFNNTPSENDTSKLVYCKIEYAKNTKSYPDYYGGAVGVKNFSKLVISGCLIRYNYAEYGGGIAICNSQPIIKNNYIICNDGIAGEGIYLDCNSKLQNNVICNNYGEGIHISGASPEVINNTICYNREGLGCGFGSNPVIKNSIFWGNTMNQIFLYKDNNHPEIEYCNIQGGLENIIFGYSINVYENNIDAEPYFGDINNMDFSLSDSSYCINMGTPDTTGLNLPVIDIAGNPRIYDGVVDIIDIGAYEYQGEPANEEPVIYDVEDQEIFVNTNKQMKVEFFDPDIYDTHTISITTSTPYISITNLSGDTTGSTYEIIPDYNWKGIADIYVEVGDNNGAKDIDTFRLQVTNHFCGTISKNITWDIDTVKVDCDIFVDTNATLTIKPGTVIEFQGNYKINVKGRLLAVGTLEDYITFTVSDTSGYHDNSFIGWGGIHFINTPAIIDTSKLIHCKVQFIRNETGYGGLSISGFSKVVISKCEIKHNIVSDALMEINNTFSVIEGNYITENKIMAGSVIIDIIKANSRIVNNVICNNECNYCLFSFTESDAEILNNTVCFNKCGGALLSGALSDPLFVNTIFWGNYSDNSLSIGYFYKWTCHPVFEYCIIPEELYTEEFTMNNVIFLNPWFSDPGSMDFSLSDSSYCINTGTPDTSGLNLPHFDITGNQRIYQGINARIDIGAYEFQGTPNKKPALEKTPDQYTLISTPKLMTINYIDDDVDSVCIFTDNTNVSVANLTGDTSGSKYELVPAAGWEGEADITIRIEDAFGNSDSDTFKLYVSKYFCGIISEDVLWDIDTVKIICDITIEDGVTLTVAPGTTIELQGNYLLDVQGRILAEGTELDQITFTVADTAGYYNNEHTGWGGIRFYKTQQTNDTSKLVHCILEYGKSTPVYIWDFNKLLIDGCNIRYNYGGGIFLNSSDIIIRNNKIYNNKNDGKGGGIQIAMASNPLLINNIIFNNTANRGGGISVISASFNSINNTICGNQAEKGGGIYLDAIWQGSVVKNTVIYSNSAEIMGSQVYINYSSNYVEYHYCNIEGGKENIEGEGSGATFVYINNIDTVPYFANEESYDFRLTDSSACINAGDPLTDISGFPFDISGNPRIIGDTIDIGAYEYPINFAPSDIMLSDNLIDENAIPGSIVGVFSTIDANNTDTHTYSFDTGDGINDADNGSFIILANTLKISISPDYEEKDTFKIFVRTTDNGANNLSFSKAFVILVNDVNERPVIEPQIFNVDENSEYATIVGALTAIDEDMAQTLTYSILSGNTGDAFEINPSLGVIYVNNSEVLDYETLPVFGLAVEVQDDGPGFLTDSALITVNLNDIYEPLHLSCITSEIFKVYPNPARDHVYIEFLNEDYKELLTEIKSISGTLLYQSLIKDQLTGKIIEIDLSNLPEGLYILSLNNYKVLVTKKLEIIR